ncbi:MAG: hypothetical protein JWR19_2622 [Pedosphaera sp.]|nr:hypothetical protein [Pedosphaera sp.]
MAVRSKLNGRLEDGESHRAVLRWLNELPEVKEILAREFEGKRINDPNLTAWSQGGFAEWQLRRELVGEAQQEDETVMEFREEREERCGKRTESALQNLGLSLGFRYAGVISEYDRDPLSESLVKKVKVLRAVTHGVVALQLSEVRSGQLQLNTQKVLPHGASALPMGDREAKCGMQSAEGGIIGEQKKETPAGTSPQVLPHGSTGDKETKCGVRHFEKGSFSTECEVVEGDGRKSILQNASAIRMSGEQKNLSSQSSAAVLTTSERRLPPSTTLQMAGVIVPGQVDLIYQRGFHLSRHRQGNRQCQQDQPAFSGLSEGLPCHTMAGDVVPSQRNDFHAVPIGTTEKLTDRHHSLS